MVNRQCKGVLPILSTATAAESYGRQDKSAARNAHRVGRMRRGLTGRQSAGIAATAEMPQADALGTRARLLRSVPENDRLVDECDGGVFVFRRAVESVNKAVNKTKLGKRPIC